MSRPAIHTVCVLSTLLSIAAARADEATFPVTFPWGRIAATADTVELHVEAVPKDRIIAIPRFHNSYERVYLKSDKSKTQLKFRPEVGQWLVTVPDSVDRSATIIIETVGKPQLLSKPFVNRADARGSYVLPAHHAIVHGELLRFEPQPHKNTIGYWQNEQDWCEWKLSISKPGKFAVHVLQGCGKGHGGSEVEVRIGDSRLTFPVEDTGHFQNFKDREVGILNIPNVGEQSLQVVPLRKAKGAIMDIRELRLVPLAAESHGQPHD